MAKLKRKEIIKKYLDFFKSKNHKIILGSSLIPENDPSVLFTTAGMHPLVPFLLGQPHPEGKRIASVQKCIRTGDIDEVGDAFHHTFFEMLGNWSLGDYFKEEAIKMSFEYLTKVLKLPVERLGITCFEGDKDAPKDEFSSKIWQKLGIAKEKIVFLSKKDNWWPTGGKMLGPCGPDTEMFYYTGKDVPEKFNPENNEWCEIWNDVFMEYNQKEEGKYIELKQKNVDTGMGVERTLTVLNGFDDNYLTEIFQPAIKRIEELSKKQYGESIDTTKNMRIIADHLRAAMFILAEKILPSNLDQGYILRRFIRRSIRCGKLLGIEQSFGGEIVKTFIEVYKEDCPEIKENENFILKEIEKEEENFRNTLEKGIKEFEKIKKKSKKTISGKDAFLLFASYGFPIEMTKELARENKLKVEEESFKKEFEKHQKLSRIGAEKKFKGGLSEQSEETAKLHTATHLLNQALREVLGKQVQQRGSNITPERLRFDFNFDRKLTPEELKKVEDIVNKKIKAALLIKCKEMETEKAVKSGAQGVFAARYGKKVTVYSVGDYSKEICMGPHVNNTKELGKFKIKKEESIAAGVRRIKAILEKSK